MIQDVGGKKLSFCESSVAWDLFKNCAHRKSVTWCEVFKNLSECTQANPTTRDQSSEKFLTAKVMQCCGIMTIRYERVWVKEKSMTPSEFEGQQNRASGGLSLFGDR